MYEPEFFHMIPIISEQAEYILTMVTAKQRKTTILPRVLAQKP